MACSLLTLVQLLLMLWSLVTNHLCPNFRMVWGLSKPGEQFLYLSFTNETEIYHFWTSLSSNHCSNHFAKKWDAQVIMSQQFLSQSRVFFNQIFDNAYQWMWKVLMTSSVNKSMLFKMPYHVQGSACHQNLPNENLSEHLGLETLPWNAEYPSWRKVRF